MFPDGHLAFPNTIVSTYSMILQHNLVATGRFITLLPKSMLEVMAKRAPIKALPVHLPATRRKMAIVVLKKRTLSPIAQFFIESVCAVAKPRQKAKKSTP